MLSISAAAVAGPAAPAGTADPYQDPEMLMAGFANNHPDLYFRRSALLSLEKGENKRAMRMLTRAARVGDKPSQALMAEILFNGSHQQPQQRAAGYAWMDLAAERGYPDLLRQREAYWALLSATEQAQALALGEGFYARYGDDVALPRLAKELRHVSRRVVGSRTGFAANVTLSAPAPNSVTTGGIQPAVTLPGARFYAVQHWSPEQYIRQKDVRWTQAVTERAPGQTSVGPLAPVKPAR